MLRKTSFAALCLSCAFTLNVLADLPGFKPPTQQPSIFDQKKKPAAPPQSEPSGPNTPRIIPRQQANVPKEIFPFPGLIGVQNGEWASSENFYNLPSAIEVFVEIVKPSGKAATFVEDELKQKVVELLRAGGISASAVYTPGSPPLPLYHVLILANEVEDYGIVYVSCRLIEEVNLDRINLPNDVTFQAITWEKQDLLTSSKADITRQALKSIEEFTNAFTDRFRFFQQVKAQTERR